MISNAYLRLRELMLATTNSEGRAKNDQQGQGMIEYALILVLIAVVVIGILAVIGKQANSVFSNISSGLGT